MKSRLYWVLGMILFLAFAAPTYKLIKKQIEIAAIERELASFPKIPTKQQPIGQTESTSKPAETTNAENPPTTETLDNEPTATTQDNAMLPDISTSEPAGMSPHGFGAYPEVPEGTLIGTFDETQSVQQELLGRVLVKLWNDGDRHIGGWVSGETGKVYPYYHDVIYVKYETEFNEIIGKNETNITEATSSPLITPVVLDSILQGNIPTGYKLIDIDNTGINPYEFLDLSK